MKYKGSITTKVTNGKQYYVHQYRDGNTVRNKTVNKEEAYQLAFNIFHSKNNDLDELLNHTFKTEVKFGESLRRASLNVASYKYRYCCKDLNDFLYDDKYGKVCALYGLRRTGKTTLIFQSIFNMSFSDFSKTAYLKMDNNVTFYDLLDDLRYLTDHDFKFIYIDEITLLENFQSLASTLSDIYGMYSKIVISGTDSLGIMIAKHYELYDRVNILHTTYISFKEFSEVLGIDSIDTYIEYGGLMTIENNLYNEVKTVGQDIINEYVDSAIAHNIEHSLKYYQDGSHFMSLYPFYEKKELTNIVNRVIEDSNHRFALDVIESTFKSHDYGSLKELVKKNVNKELSESLDKIDEEKIVKKLMNELDIINKEMQTQKVDDAVITDVHAYLELLDLCKTIDIVNVPTFRLTKRNVFTQPGLRYAQAKALLTILMNSDELRDSSLIIKDFLKAKLLSDIKGKMLEEIVLYQTSVTNKDTFKLIFTMGEIDMVTLDKEKHETSIYEVKYSTEVNSNQYRFLIDESNIDIIERAYYPVKHKYVLYRGKSQNVEGIHYINVEEYLKGLAEKEQNND